MRITIADYAKWKKVSVQAVTWRIRKNAQINEPLHTDLPDVTAVYKLGRSYELEFNGVWIEVSNKKLKVLKTKAELKQHSTL